MFCVRTLLATDDDDDVDLRVFRKNACSILVFFGRVADGIGAIDAARDVLDRSDDILEVGGVECRLIEDLDFFELRPIDLSSSLDRRDDVVGGRIEIIRVADDLAVFRVADENEVVAVLERLFRLAMDVVDELAGRSILRGCGMTAARRARRRRSSAL